jgi:hypothetical protein
VLGPLFSVLFEVLALKKQMNNLELLTLRPDEAESGDVGWSSSRYSTTEVACFVVAKVMLHLCVHAVGIYLKLSIQAIKRDTFIKVGMTISRH